MAHQLNDAAGRLLIEVLPGSALSAARRRQITELCSAAFEEDMQPLLQSFSDAVHVIGLIDGRPVSHGLWITRWLQPAGMAPLRTAYVEAVATDAAWRGRGCASAVMRRIAAEVRHYELAALSPSDAGFYTRLDWQVWQGPLLVRTADDRLEPTPDETVMILRLPQTPPLDLTRPLSIEWRDGEVW